VHWLDRIPVGVQDLRRVFILVEQIVNPALVEFLAHDEIQNRIIQRVIEAIRLFGEAALDERHDQGQEIIRQARAFRDQRGQRQVGGGADHQGVTLERGVGEQA
nr:hypothetical protein [Tanacetum cinerariifolium]